MNFGIPDFPDRGWLWDYKLTTTNNSRQVAFAADFLPITATVQVPNPWVVIQATPASLPLTIQTASLPAAVTGQPYSQTLKASGGSASGYMWSVSAGSLPSGFTLGSAGVLTPQAARPPSSSHIRYR